MTQFYLNKAYITGRYKLKIVKIQSTVVAIKSKHYPYQE